MHKRVLARLPVLSYRRARRVLPFRSKPGRLLLWSTLAMGIAALLIPWAAPLASAFGFVPLSPVLALATVLVIAT